MYLASYTILQFLLISFVLYNLCEIELNLTVEEIIDLLKVRTVSSISVK